MDKQGGTAAGVLGAVQPRLVLTRASLDLLQIQSLVSHFEVVRVLSVELA